ncbi:H-2 class II histocompatibility antigen, A-U alpha chain-like [Centroberyx affinis]|uniref:H-2 class II histocompatibility antigen, A-U alpha chain-like n=1 Tax=Centroberyx affinis TaxID=166261 RepID=UPI003A5BDA69
MKHAAIFTLILNICVASEIPHEYVYSVGCFFNDTEIQLDIDDEELFYADFRKEEIVYTAPSFFAFDPSVVFVGIKLFRNAVRQKKACAGILAYLIEEEKNPPEEKDAPESTIYTSEEVELGVENSLICFVNHFYPPSINVSWTKNGQLVSERASLGRYHFNNDGTFRQFSTLIFTPREGDVYSCIVEHPALEEPKVRIWEPDLSSPSLGPDVFCGVGLTLGMLGVAVGTFFMVKGHHGQ